MTEETMTIKVRTLQPSDSLGRTSWMMLGGMHVGHYKEHTTTRHFGQYTEEEDIWTHQTKTYVDERWKSK